MKDLISHLKKVAIDDFRDFFAPFVTVVRAIRKFASVVSARARRSIDQRRKGTEE
jgi:hypothetical protein